MGQLVKLAREDGYAVVTLDHPPVNALNAPLLTELEAVVAELEGDESVRAVIIHGAGEKAFAAGADITEFPRLSPDQAESLSRRGQAIFDRLSALPKPVIAAVHGYALGGGCELAMACDIRIAAESARLGQPEINLGILPGYGGTQRLPRLVGPSRALLMCLTGDPVSAAEALRIGLVDLVVPDAELLPRARELAAKLAGKAPVAARLIKRAVYGGLATTLAEGTALEARLFAEVFATADAREGVQAFLEKRAPRWVGR
ncbi:enoyl-CoA hydratase-related protein [Caldinitratiruptor microaerophilus]|uniref:short-chain-enoyl-CoA hydratase n=1 Tax=Caldinitratiruptor microaerophilus TaxID=671077 RepID=A0AA35CP69_9FIRM|nr:enoyl-CoA hydratase-related protein [Caldinitratiruptor microaerophilus]BDG61061.1 crotonase [Caldinitratiruptor microaerophilus]